MSVRLSFVATCFMFSCLISMLFIIPMLNYNVEATTEDSCDVHLYDNFDIPYFLGEGQTSPNGEWKNVYSGYGSTGVAEVGGKSVFYLKPNASSTPYDTHTHAALVKSTDKFCDFEMEFDINTVKQLRKNSPPNVWEVGWIDFRYVDKFHHYSLLFKPNGIELGKKDCDSCTNPCRWSTIPSNKLHPNVEAEYLE